MKTARLALVALGALVMSSCATTPLAPFPGTGEKLRIAIPELVPRTSGSDADHFARILPEIIGHDLRFSSLFTVVADEPSFPSDPVALRKRLADLAAAGTQAAMQGWVGVSGQRVTVEFRLLDLMRPGFHPIAAKTFWAEPLQLHRGLAHRIADEIVYQLTGEGGIAETKIAYVTKAGANKELAWMDYDGFNQAPLTALQSVSLSPVWSPREPILAFTSFFRGYPYLWRLNPYNARQREPELIAAWPGINSVAAWAPDGQTVALTLSYQGNPEIYSFRPGKSDFKRLTDHRGIDTDATWSPTGRELAFSSDREGGAPRIWIMDDQGLNARRLTGGRFDTQPRWSPRGDTIVFTRWRGGTFDLWAIAPDGSDERRLTTGPGRNSSAAWAPDGRHLVFSSTRTGRSQLFTMLADGTEQRILQTRDEATSPSWSPRPE
jgi:TolB protein